MPAPVTRSRTAGERLLEKLQRREMDHQIFPVHNPTPPSDESVREIIDRFLSTRFPQFSPEQRAEHHARYRQEVEEANAQLPTDCEDPLCYSIVRRVQGEIEKAMRASGIPVPHPVVIGTLPSARVNALTQIVPASGEHVIAFDRATIRFAHLIAGAVSLLLPLRTAADGGIEFEAVDAGRAVEDAPHLVAVVERAFAPFLMASYRVYDDDGGTSTIVLNYPSGPDRLTVPYPNSLVSALLCHAMELFMMGHEYAHIALGHTTDTTAPDPTATDPIDRGVFRLYRQEHEADYLGVSLALRAQADDLPDLSSRLLGPELFLLSLNLLWKGTTLYRTGEEPAEVEPDLTSNVIPAGLEASHPPPYLRLAMIRNNVRQQLLAAGLSADAADRYLFKNRLLDRLMTRLWRKVSPFVRRCHSEDAAARR